jgi:1-acyl-sn-glycerol-3-phosphate acyltransferase
MLSWFAGVVLRLAGWKPEGQPPDVPKYVIIAAPHTSNWDFPFTIMFATYFRLKFNYMIKDEMMRPPWGWFFRALGGIPINRRSRNNVVEQSIERLRQAERLALVVPPEGTRSKVTRWRTGFYYIALGAGVPIALGFLDFKRKVGGFGPLFYPTGDIEADMARIRSFYQGITGKRPQQFGEITIAPAETISEQQDGS